MKVTIVGGWSETPKDNEDWKLDVSDRTTFIAACESIGKRLAEKLHTIVVGSDREHSADPHVIRGFLSKFENRAAPDGLIQVIEGIQGEGKLYKEERGSAKHQNIFVGEDSSFPDPKPRAAEKILATRAADALIAIGGLHDTYVAGIAAMLARKPVLPFASFGGASRQLWDAVHMLDQKRLTGDFRRLSDRMWHDDLIDAAFRFGGLDRPRVFLGSSGKAHDTALEIKDYIESLGFNVIFWEEDFGAGRVILDEIREASFSCKYAILLCTPDEQIAGEGRRVPRPNVVFELGYFINALGTDGTRLIVREGTSLPSDYGGHIYIPLAKNARISSIQAKLKEFLARDLPEQEVGGP